MKDITGFNNNFRRNPIDSVSSDKLKKRLTLDDIKNGKSANDTSDVSGVSGASNSSGSNNNLFIDTVVDRFIHGNYSANDMEDWLRKNAQTYSLAKTKYETTFTFTYKGKEYIISCSTEAAEYAKDDKTINIYTAEEVKEDYTDEEISKYFKPALTINGEVISYMIDPKTGCKNFDQLDSYIINSNSADSGFDRSGDRSGDAEIVPGISINDILANIDNGKVDDKDISTVTGLLKEIFEKFNCETDNDKERYTRALVKLLNSISGSTTLNFELANDSINKLNDTKTLNQVRNIINNGITMEILAGLDGGVDDVKCQKKNFIMAGLYALNNTEYGRNAIYNAITVDPSDGSIIVTFKGFNPSKDGGLNYVKFTIEQMQNILEGKDINGGNNAWAANDLDAQFILAAYEQLIWQTNENKTSEVSWYPNGIWEALTGDIDTYVNKDFDKNPDDDWDKNKSTIEDWLNSILRWESTGSEYAATVLINGNELTGSGIPCKDMDGNDVLYAPGANITYRGLVITGISDGVVTFKDAWTGKSYQTSWETFAQLDIIETFSNCFERRYEDSGITLDENIKTLENVEYTKMTKKRVDYYYLNPSTVLEYCNNPDNIFDPSIKQLADMLNKIFAKNHLDESEKEAFVITVLNMLTLKAGGTVSKEGLKKEDLEKLNNAGAFFNVFKEIIESPACFCKALLYKNYNSTEFDWDAEMQNALQGHSSSWIAVGILSVLNTKYAQNAITKGSVINWSNDGSTVSVRFAGLDTVVQLTAQELMDLWQDGASSSGCPTMFILEAAFSKYVVENGLRKDGDSLHCGYAQDFWSAFFADTKRAEQSKVPITVDDNVEEGDIEAWLQKLLNYENSLTHGTKPTEQNYVASFGVDIVPDDEPLVIHTTDGKTLHYSSNMTRAVMVKSVTNGIITCWDSWNGEYSMNWNDFIDTFGDYIYSLRDAVIYETITETIQDPKNSEFLYSQITSLNIEDFGLNEGDSLSITNIVDICNQERGKENMLEKNSYSKLIKLLNRAFDMYGCQTESDKAELAGAILNLLWEQYGDGSNFEDKLTSDMIDKLNEKIYTQIDDEGNNVVQKTFFDKLSDVINGNYMYTLNWLKEISGTDFDSKSVTVYRMDEPGITCSNGEKFVPTSKTDVIIREVKDGLVKFFANGKEYETTLSEFARLNIYNYKFKHEGLN